MITVSPLKVREEICAVFEKQGFEVNKNSGAVVARDKEEILGFSLYYLDEKSITVLCVEPKEDIMLADGILRSALHVAAERSAMDAKYQGECYEELYEKLGFIKDKTNKILDIDKLFGGCNCHK